MDIKISESTINENVVMCIDVGGTLIKLTLLVDQLMMNKEKINALLPLLNQFSLNNSKNLKSSIENFNFYFYLFEKKAIPSLIDLIDEYSDCIFRLDSHKIMFTGTCSNSFKRELHTRLKNKFHLLESLDIEFESAFGGVCLIDKFFNKHSSEWYTYEKVNGMSRTSVNNVDESFILVVVGTGTSILLVNKNSVTYLTHSNISGATYLGLCKLLCGFKTFEESIRAAKLGNNKSFDCTIMDILENNEQSLSEMSETMMEANVTHCVPDFDFIVNSFGKLNSLNVEELKKESTINNLSNSILLMVVNSCTLNACHFAKNYKCKQILFAGSFLLNNNYAKYKISSLVSYLTSASIQAVFTEKDAFINSIGGFFNYKHNKVCFHSFM